MHKNGISKTLLLNNRINRWAVPHTVIYNKYTAKFTGALIKRGDRLGGIKKYNQLQYWVKKNYRLQPHKMLYVAYLKLSPVLQPRYVKVGGKMQSVAYGLMSEDKRVTFGIKWAVKMVRDKSKTGNLEVAKLASGLFEATRNQGELYKHKQQWEQGLIRNTRKMPMLVQRLRTSRITNK